MEQKPHDIMGLFLSLCMVEEFWHMVFASLHRSATNLYGDHDLNIDNILCPICVPGFRFALLTADMLSLACFQV
jgi:hypothetical protein